jgi:uroporphyrinogen III methyltransferase / synthase
VTLRPLTGLRVVVTRPEHQASGLVAAFAAAGTAVEELPLLAVVPPSDLEPLLRAAAEVAAGTGRFDWIVFTSANGVDAFLDRLARLGHPLPDGLRAAVVGPATATALRRHGREADLVATGGDAAGLAAELGPLAAARLAAGQAPLRVLFPMAADAGPAIAAGLTAGGAEVTRVVAYDKRLPAGAPARARRIFGVDPADPLGWVTFTSPRTVAHFVSLFGEGWRTRCPTLRAASIGPVTTRALARAGIDPAAEAASPGDGELVEAVTRAAGRQPASG